MVRRVRGRNDGDWKARRLLYQGTRLEVHSRTHARRSADRQCNPGDDLFRPRGTDREQNKAEGDRRGKSRVRGGVARSGEDRVADEGRIRGLVTCGTQRLVDSKSDSRLRTQT